MQRRPKVVTWANNQTNLLLLEKSQENYITEILLRLSQFSTILKCYQLLFLICFLCFTKYWVLFAICVFTCGSYFLFIIGPTSILQHTALVCDHVHKTSLLSEDGETRWGHVRKETRGKHIQTRAALFSMPKRIPFKFLSPQSFSLH